MPFTAAFHSVNELQKADADRIYHNNSACPTGREIPLNDRVAGNGGYRVCPECEQRNRLGR